MTSDATPANALDARPILGAVLLLIAAFLLRLNDIFVLRLDELWGEIILSKALGFLLVLGFVWLMGKPTGAIGLHRQRIWTSVGIGLLLTVGIYLVSYGIEVAILWLQGDGPSLLVAAIDPKQGVSGGAIFALWLLLGNVVNALMEEGLFRGVFIPVLMTRMGFWAANALQAVLFGLWHLVWPLKEFVSGRVSLGGALAMGGLLMLGSAINGLIWGYMLFATGSLWAPIAAHFAANTIQNLFHVQSAGGLDQLVSVRGAAASIVGLALIPVIGRLGRRFRMPRLRPWAAWHRVRRIRVA